VQETPFGRYRLRELLGRGGMGEDARARRAARARTARAHRAAERWFLDRGLPSVLTQQARLRAIWPRSAPFLAFLATLEACSAATYQLTGRHEYIGAPIAVQRIGLAVALLALPVAAGVGWFVARMLTDHAQAIISTVSAVIGIVSGTLKGLTFQQHLAYLIAGSSRLRSCLC
jgi:hypothetical protein